MTGEARMENDPRAKQGEESSEAEPSSGSPPPYDPDPRLVEFLERGIKRDAPEWFRRTEPRKR